MRLVPPNSSIRIKPVSIHASVKDATYTDINKITERRVSIHASVKDATLPISRVVVPRLVSIHASVKDATKVNDNEVSWS